MSIEDLRIDITEWNAWIKRRFPNKDFISFEDLFSDYEELIDEVDDLKEKIEDLRQDLEDNYRPISKSEQYDISDEDFIC